MDTICAESKRKTEKERKENRKRIKKEKKEREDTIQGEVRGKQKKK